VSSAIDPSGVAFALGLATVAGGGAYILGLRYRRTREPSLTVARWVLGLTVFVSVSVVILLPRLWWFSALLFVGGCAAWWEIRRLIKARPSQP
jgi:multisubunit Na+/H+ antiporter MnhB subunit